ncbi:hypothetical protein MBT84_14265 [Streptomyces sp. MBT84]|nr:hypothetical protein [Streptomyces sp. MBT84]
MTVRTRSMSHSADYRSQPEATLEVPQLSGKARCPRRPLVTGYPAAARYSGLVRDRSRGLLRHQCLRGLEQDGTRSDELELVLLPGGAPEPRHRT